MKDELEVQCPKCGNMFKGKDKMFEHLDSEHVSDKEHFKELILEIDARYLGGHTIFSNQINGNLSLYSNPQNKVVFVSTKFRLEIPISKIKSAMLKDNILVMDFEDNEGTNETLFFNHSVYLTEFSNELLNLRIGTDASEKTIEKGKTKETIIKVRCHYCTYTYDKKLDKCPHCGAMKP